MVIRTPHNDIDDKDDKANNAAAGAVLLSCVHASGVQGLVGYGRSER